MSTNLSPGDHVTDMGIATLHYRVAGKGPVLLVQSGGAGWGGDAAAYPSVLHPLEARHTVIYLEPRRLGFSTGPKDRAVTTESYAQDIEALRRHLGLERFTLFGHSHGGFVALRYALDHPEALDRLILVGSAPTLQLGDRSTWIASRREAAAVFARIAEVNERGGDPHTIRRATIGYAQAGGWGQANENSGVPTAALVLAHDVGIRRYADRENRITRLTDVDRGGHFAALEEPDLLVGDVREFFRALR